MEIKKLKKKIDFLIFFIKYYLNIEEKKVMILNFVWENVIRKGIYCVNIYKGFYWLYELLKIKGNIFLVFM